MVVSRLAAAQANLGHDVHLVCYDTPKVEEQIASQLSKLPGHKTLKRETMPPATRAEWYLSRGATKFISQLLDLHRFDAVHLHGLWDPILKTAAQVAGSRGVPYVIAPHGMLDAWALTEKPVKKKIALALGYRAMIRRARLIHALSDYEDQCIRAHGWNSNVAIIPNGVFLEEIDPLPPKGEFHAKHPELGGGPFVLFLARLHPVKGLDLLVDAFAAIRSRHPEVRVVVAGPDFGAKAALETQIAQLGVQNRVFLVGPLWGRDKLAALSDAMCFSLPSKHEGFSMSIAEALAARLPVVITENCHFPQVHESGAGVVVKRETGEIAKALDQVLSDSSARERMGAAGRRLIEERYTWTKVAEKSLAEYARMKPGA
jgi:glycosyltransferase involved in cell wall biosynthesis